MSGEIETATAADERSVMSDQELLHSLKREGIMVAFEPKPSLPIVAMVLNLYQSDSPGLKITQDPLLLVHTLAPATIGEGKVESELFSLRNTLLATGKRRSPVLPVLVINGLFPDGKGEALPAETVTYAIDQLALDLETDSRYYRHPEVWVVTDKPKSELEQMVESLGLDYSGRHYLLTIIPEPDLTGVERRLQLLQYGEDLIEPAMNKINRPEREKRAAEQVTIDIDTCLAFLENASREKEATFLMKPNPEFQKFTRELQAAKAELDRLTGEYDHNNRLGVNAENFSAILSSDREYRKRGCKLIYPYVNRFIEEGQTDPEGLATLKKEAKPIFSQEEQKHAAEILEDLEQRVAEWGNPILEKNRFSEDEQFVLQYLVHKFRQLVGVKLKESIHHWLYIFRDRDRDLFESQKFIEMRFQKIKRRILKYYRGKSGEEFEKWYEDEREVMLYLLDGLWKENRDPFRTAAILYLTQKTLSNDPFGGAHEQALKAHQESQKRYMELKTKTPPPQYVANMDQIIACLRDNTQVTQAQREAVWESLVNAGLLGGLGDSQSFIGEFVQPAELLSPLVRVLLSELLLRQNSKRDSKPLPPHTYSWSRNYPPFLPHSPEVRFTLGALCSQDGASKLVITRVSKNPDTHQEATPH